MFSDSGTEDYYPDCRPWTRWWWFSGEIRHDDIRYQLDWLKDNGFGGVEIAWVYPQPHAKRGPKFLSPEWTDAVVFAKQYCDQIGLGCDFTFGTLWPFGGSMVDEQDASRTIKGLSEQRLKWTWEDPFVSQPGLIIDHLNKSALERYSKKIGDGLSPALSGSRSALFCDSWEIDTDGLWTHGFADAFRDRYKYEIEEYIDELDNHPSVRYDYRRQRSEYIIENFYRPFTKICHDLGAVSRVQCHGSPTDLLEAYASADIPETEALLFEPSFAKIAASAAAISGKKTVTSETFTCMYGWSPKPGPTPYLGEEQIADMKLIVDSLFANGVNQVVWHGMPYNPKGGSNHFYAGVHVGPDAHCAPEFKPFNDYMHRVSSFMRSGRAFTDIAVYMPVEDAWMAGEIGPGIYPPDAKYDWEFRYLKMPDELAGRQPMWVSGKSLKDAQFIDGRMILGNSEFTALYVDVKWMNEESLIEIFRLAAHGLPVCMKRDPMQPGHGLTRSFESLHSMKRCIPGLASNLDDLHVAIGPLGRNAPLVTPLVTSLTDQPLPEFFCRIDGDSHIFFFAHPKSREVTFPMTYGQSHCTETITMKVEINVGSKGALAAAVESVTAVEPVTAVELSDGFATCPKPQKFSIGPRPIGAGRGDNRCEFEIVPVELEFKPYQSLIVEVSSIGKVTHHDATYLPPTPKTIKP